MNRKNKSKRWAVGYDDPKKTSDLIRAMLNEHSIEFIKWTFFVGLAQSHWLRRPIVICNSCLNHAEETPGERCFNRGFHKDRSTLRYSRLKTGPRTYHLDAEGNAPLGIYETNDQRKDRLAEALEADIIAGRIKSDKH